MDKFKLWWQDRRPTTRRLIQLYTALLYNAHLKGFVKGEIYRGRSKAICVPGLNCYSCPAAVGACPLGALQNAVAASATRPAFYVVGVLLLFGLFFGRVICGWACPMGLIQELLHKLPTPKLKKSRLTRALSWVKYGLLSVFVLAIPLYYAVRRVPLPAFCKYICPAGTLEGALGLLLHPANRDKLGMLGLIFTRKFLVLVLILTACVFVYRAFCRFFCPLGAIYGLMTRLALVGVKLERSLCTDCGACRHVCPMDILSPGDREGISCGRCIGRCPTAAITLRAGKAVLSGTNTVPAGIKPRRWTRLLAWLLALMLLGGAMVYYNPSAGATAEAPPGSTVVAGEDAGSAVGQRLPDFTVTRVDGGIFRLSETRGQVVVLNLWATWCGPCVQELPLFDKFSSDHGDAAVLAIHSGPIVEDVPAWLAQHDYAIPFAIDPDGKLTASLGASAMLPHTVVLDRTGIVVYNAPGSVTAALLEELYSRAK